MARIAGVDIPRDKRLEIALTYIYGIGLTTAQKICDEIGLDRSRGKPSQQLVADARGLARSQREARQASHRSVRHGRSVSQ